MQTLLSKAWGFGFFSDLFTTAGHLLLAEICQRQPIVHWGHESLFHNPAEPERDAYSLFFEPVGTLPDAPLLKRLGTNDFTCYPPKWSLDNLTEKDISKWQGEHSRMRPKHYLSRDENLLVCDFVCTPTDTAPLLPESHPWYGLSPLALAHRCIEKYIHPQPALIEEAARFVRTRIPDPAHTVAIHFRGSDKIHEISNYAFEPILQEFFKALTHAQAAGMHTIYLMTDDNIALSRFQKHFGADRVIATNAHRTSNHQGIHYLNPGTQSGREVLLDALIAQQCGYFIGNGLSNTSLYIACARNWHDHILLLGGNVLLRTSEPLYDSTLG